MVVGTCDFKLGRCGHSLRSSLREKIRLRQPGQQHGAIGGKPGLYR
jgi:hypothetical protein